MTITFKQFINEALNFRDLLDGEFDEEQQQSFLNKLRSMELNPKKYIDISDQYDFDGEGRNAKKLVISIDWNITPSFFQLYDLLNADNKKEAIKLLGNLVKETDKEFKEKIKEIDLSKTKFDLYLGPYLEYALQNTDFQPDFAKYIAKSAAKRYNDLNDNEVRRINTLSGDEQKRAMEKFAKNIEATLNNLSKVSGRSKKR